MKKIIIIGGGTFSHIRNHLALAAPAFGTTAKEINKICGEKIPKMETSLILTQMAGGSSSLNTNEDIKQLVEKLKNDLDVKIVFFNVAMCDFSGKIGDIDSGKYSQRLKTSEGKNSIDITPLDKVIKSIRDGRKDILLVGFKTTCDATEDEQYVAGLNLLKKNSCNLVLANDTKTRINMIITPEEARYCVTSDRQKALEELVEMANLRSQLSFTRSTVVSGELISWNSPLIPSSLRTVVNYCINQNAYKPFNGATVGHFATKVSEKEFLTSVRKSNFNDLEKNGLVRVTIDGNDTVTAYGAKPSVGGQSQRIIFSEHNDYDCIVHFHCPINEGSLVPVVSQKEYECGSHECGKNTSDGLKRFGNLSAVMLDNHGPNIVFHHSIDPQEVIDFIEDNFNLSSKTGGVFKVEALETI
jgi:hypothetical protein